MTHRMIAGASMTQGFVRVKGRQWAAHDININSDDYFDNIRGCWKSDPLCGLDTVPKRPW